MKSESQIIEYKESWHDEYLKWICGFANAQGGTLYIGVNDDKQVVGAKNVKRLMEDIPNMVKDRMGILVDVNLREADGKEYLQIKISPSPNPISVRGKYYYRTGSTLQELKGTALDQFLLSKQGRTWDSVPVPGLSARMLDGESVNLFKKEAARSPHSSAEDVRVDELPVPVNALREIILNAICHKSYEEFIPIQIRVYDDRIIISNTGRLPMGWTINNLVGKHTSIPYNPGIANAFFRVGFIESWGRGIEKVLAACKDYGCPKPEWKFDGTVLSMTMRYKKSEIEGGGMNSNPDKVSNDGDILDRIVRDVSKMCPRYVQDVSKMILALLQNKADCLDIPALMDSLGEKSRRLFTRKSITPALESGLIERTVPDKPTSRYQKYRLTDKALHILKGGSNI